ncbi:DUF397 domain-containing protein [Amycolatopsis minnesotensis]|uniref:DUF397 domain-containing protein n=1 Tax=Amycolatopsis minnesotensis TaxID=337894 RepID=A0ABP5C074_9PSEU
MVDRLESVAWRKSSYSSGDPDKCVEIAVASSVIGIRDTKDRDGGRLTLTPDAFTSLTRILAG